MQPIPFIRVSGDHYEAGRQIGAACRDALARSLDAIARGAARWQNPGRICARPPRPTWRRPAPSLPWIVEELRGAARGAAIDLLDLAVLGIEEIWGEGRGRPGLLGFRRRAARHCERRGLAGA